MQASSGDFKDERLARLADEPLRTYPINPLTDIKANLNCPNCRSHSAVVDIACVYLEDRPIFATGLCERCLYVFRTVHPSDDWFAKCWSMLPAVSPTADGKMEAVRREAYVVREEFIREWLPQKPAHVLEIGAGYGGGVDVLESLDYVVDAMIEPDPVKAEFLRETKRGAIFECSIQDYLKADTPVIGMRRSWLPVIREFDLIIMSHVFEHCSDPRFVLESLSRLLSEDGIIYIEVPDLFQIVNWSDALYLAHYSNFTTDTFVSFAHNCGLEIAADTWMANEDNRKDRGFILVPRGNYKPPLTIASRASIERIKEVYRIGLSPNLAPPLDQCINYRIPNCEHFYYGLRFDRWNMVRNGDYIDFELK